MTRARGNGQFSWRTRSIGPTRRTRTQRRSTINKYASQEAKLSDLEHMLVESRNRPIVAAMTTRANGRAECDKALLMLHELIRERRSLTAGADKTYDRETS